MKLLTKPFNKKYFQGKSRSRKVKTYAKSKKKVKFEVDKIKLEG